jgi:Na+-translocating ferredoxin:NAD+ oxidoreductase RnfG subunit
MDKAGRTTARNRKTAIECPGQAQEIETHESAGLDSAIKSRIANQPHGITKKSPRTAATRAGQRQEMRKQGGQVAMKCKKF